MAGLEVAPRERRNRNHVGLELCDGRGKAASTPIRSQGRPLQIIAFLRALPPLPNVR